MKDDPGSSSSNKEPADGLSQSYLRKLRHGHWPAALPVPNSWASEWLGARTLPVFRIQHAQARAVHTIVPSGNTVLFAWKGLSSRVVVVADGWKLPPYFACLKRTLATGITPLQQPASLAVRICSCSPSDMTVSQQVILAIVRASRPTFRLSLSAEPHFARFLSFGSPSAK